MEGADEGGRERERERKQGGREGCEQGERAKGDLGDEAGGGRGNCLFHRLVQDLFSHQHLVFSRLPTTTVSWPETVLCFG